MGDRLSASEIEKMVEDAALFEEEDKKVRAKIEARNKLEQYIYSMKSTVTGSEGVASKISDADKETVEKELGEANDWLDDNQEADTEDFTKKLSELQSTCAPIIAKVYGGSDGGGGFDASEEDLEGQDDL